MPGEDDAAVADEIFVRAVFVGHLGLAAVLAEQRVGAGLLHVVDQIGKLVAPLIEGVQRADEEAGRELVVGVIAGGQTVRLQARIGHQHAAVFRKIPGQIVPQPQRHGVVGVHQHLIESVLQHVVADLVGALQLAGEHLVGVDHGQRQLVGAGPLHEQIAVVVPLLAACQIHPADGDVLVGDLPLGQIPLDDLAQRLAGKVGVEVILRVRAPRRSGPDRRRRQQQHAQQQRAKPFDTLHPLFPVPVPPGW